MKTLRPIRHEDRLSIIDHLDELRSRIIICGSTLLVAFLACFWQNGPLIDVLNRALPPSAKTGLGDQANQDASLHKYFLQLQREFRGLSYVKGMPPAAKAYFAQIAKTAHHAAAVLPVSATAQEKPIVFGVSESFTTTLMVAGYFALLFTLPVLLYQLYAFIIPALSKSERKVAIPAMISSPALFTVGAVFTYFAILPPAVHFLQGYNNTKFQVVVQASSYYKFEIILLLGIGLAFQIPLFLLALQKAGLITSRTLTVNWRYATVLIAVGAAALPGVDPVSMVMETLPLVALYVASILLLKFAERQEARHHRTKSPDD